MTDEIREALTIMISDIIGSKRLLDDSTLLYHELGISGDDAWDLIGQIHTRFGTLWDRLEFANYFPSETESFIWHLRRLFLADDKHKELSFGHLVRVVAAGKWFEADTAQL